MIPLPSCKEGVSAKRKGSRLKTSDPSSGHRESRTHGRELLEGGRWGGGGDVDEVLRWGDVIVTARRSFKLCSLMFEYLPQELVKWRKTLRSNTGVFLRKIDRIQMLTRV